MRTHPATLYFMCGKMAAGKSTHAKALAQERNAVLMVQDDLLAGLYPGEILVIPDFVKYSTRLRDTLAPHIVALLSRGVSVVLDFPSIPALSVNGSACCSSARVWRMSCTTSTRPTTFASSN